MTARQAEKAILAGGCFWGIQYYFDQLEGVISTRVGYTGGKLERPTYEQVCFEDTGHAEATEILFDTSKISYRELLVHFFAIHNPTTPNRQGPDIGEQYRSAIFYTTSQQRETALSLIAELERSGMYGSAFVTQVLTEEPFWEAEAYHQKYTERTGRGACHFINEDILANITH